MARPNLKRRLFANPGQQKAYNAMRAALHEGSLCSAAECARCHAPQRFGRDGRNLLQGHHKDYSKPLEVEWLCVKCHRKVTRLAIGELNGSAVMNARLAVAAQLLFAEGFSCEEIACFYSSIIRVSRQAVSMAVHGQLWSRATKEYRLALTKDRNEE